MCESTYVIKSSHQRRHLLSFLLLLAIFDSVLPRSLQLIHRPLQGVSKVSGRETDSMEAIGQTLASSNSATRSTFCSFNPSFVIADSFAS